MAWRKSLLQLDFSLISKTQSKIQTFFSHLAGGFSSSAISVKLYSWCSLSDLCKWGGERVDTTKSVLFSRRVLEVTSASVSNWVSTRLIRVRLEWLTTTGRPWSKPKSSFICLLNEISSIYWLMSDQCYYFKHGDFNLYGFCSRLQENEYFIIRYMLSGWSRNSEMFV